MYSVGALQLHEGMQIAAMGTMLPDEMIVTPDCQPHLELMQFTGLYDKNGRGIYEGDIVRVQETMDGGRIVCLEAIATAVWNEERGCWGCEGEFSGHLADYALGTMLSLMGNCCEVIGNIYENPELMEVAEHDED
ncbi:MAG: YopX family protein [Lactobacillus sp.]|jgi:uncharacterized phage protein (TIGR01671 family)|nr:YopX family protein [Lactobacillus sp.]MCI2037177.1 YopX family protein [Lactobacillus sp.]